MTATNLPAEIRGPAIHTDRLWSRLRRNRDAPRSLQQLIKEVEKSTQVRRSGLEGVLTELQQHRDATSDAGLREALTWLCNAVTRMVTNPTAAHSREVLVAADAVKRR
ncbi:hypothetical protein [Mycobacterium paraffinicum]|uniref:Uncharacterized protein n=1 Tax=Mycobacterium paraffinicum TaxID=53378 RepID=A0ABP8F278_9MYCO